METMNIFVGNLDYQLTEDNLKTAFQAYGEAESARILTDRDTGRSKGFGFVEMPEKEEALKAIEALNGTELGGKTITVNEARPKLQRNNRRGGFGGGGRSKAGGGGRGGSGGGGRNRF
jgi:RNA recognition motif-containing protein